MADCSYARCLQERRNIKRELQRWTKNMVFVVGLERVAEELMGRRKWKLYQDVLLARNLPLPQPDDNETLSDSAAQEDEENSHMIATTETIQRHTTAADLVSTEQETQSLKAQEKPDHQQVGSPITLDEDSKEARDESMTKSNREEENAFSKEESQTAAVPSVLKIKTIEEINTVGVDSANSKEAEGGETILEGLIKRNTAGPPRRPQPADWTPQDKCYFCVDGELVRPGTTNATEPTSEAPPSPAESESGSSSSRSGASPTRAQIFRSQQQAQALVHFLQLQHANFNPSAMNQVSPMPTSLAALAALGGASGLPLGSALGLCAPTGLIPPWCLNPRANAPIDRMPSTSEKPLLSSDLNSPSTAEQPLDLSSKSSTQDSDGKELGESSTTNSDAKPTTATSPSTLEARLAGLRVPPIDPKMFKSKPRVLPPGGRKTYTEEELQMALRDIQSGKLGTRRAAVLYNIPRSTLRNKVYKMTVEKERGNRPPGVLLATIDKEDSNDVVDDMDDDNSLMDEDKEDEREIPRAVPSMEDIMRLSQMDYSNYNTPENIKNLLYKKFFDTESPKRNNPSDVWPGIEQNILGPYIQSLLMAGLGPPLIKPEDNMHGMLPDIARYLEDQQKNILKETLLKQDNLNNGKPGDCAEDELHKKMFSRQTSSTGSAKAEIKTDSSDEVPMDVDQDAGESRDSPSNVILKIPSFKPLANTPNSSKNGGEAFAGSATPPLYFSPHSDQASSRGGDHMSPPLGYSKSGILSLKDVIAKSIAQKFQPQMSPQNHNDVNQLKVNSQGMDSMDSLNAFKRGGLTPPIGSQGISVIKNLSQSHDMARSFSNNSAGNQPQQNNATGGKGTRPKRGKYRNYDRDSLVEAVKAVQRGEMSVHRAGSYYGVPHSTLEYKVKERHLMRPRKREPKNPNPDEKSTIPSASKPSDIPGSGMLRVDKMKQVPKPMTKPAFPASSPNGLKMPMFDPALALGYGTAQFPFWPPAPPFHGLPMDFGSRNPGTSGNFPTNSDALFASQMMQKLQEESARHPVAALKGNNLLKSARDMSELYESASGAANGSFLDGIIRSSLEQNSQRSRGAEEQMESNRRMRTDDVLIAEEMREATRRLKAARETVTTPGAAATTPTPTSGSANSSPPHPT